MRHNTDRSLAIAAAFVFLAVSAVFPSLAAEPGSPDAAAAEAPDRPLSYQSDPAEIPIGPGYELYPVSEEDEADKTPDDADEAFQQGDYLGEFTITGYCNCSKCSGGHNLTYSGTVPKAKHTVSADISIYPIGTKFMVDGTVYTVEDIGGGVDGNHLDIFYGTHEEALNFGRQTKKVYSVK